MDKQQQLTYDKGISNVPSDAICDDNCLQESMNMVYRDGEHQPIQNPVKLFDFNGGQVLFVHKPNNTTDKYIVQSLSGSVHWITQEDTTLTDGNKLTSNFASGSAKASAIGNILILTGDSGKLFFRWTGTGYKAFDDEMKEPKVEFKEMDDGGGYVNDYWDTVSGENCGDGIAYCQWEHINDGTPFGHYRNFRVDINDKNAWWDVAVGQYSSACNKIREAGRFWAPFYARVAVQLYDNTSYILPSAPILLFPSVRSNCLFSATDWHERNVWPIRAIVLTMASRRVGLKASFNYEDWKDVVKGVSLFITKQVEINKTDNKLGYYDNYEESFYPSIDYIKQDGTYDSPELLYGNQPWTERPTRFKLFLTKSDSEIVKELNNVTDNFYKVADLGVKREDEDFVPFDTLISTTDRKNLTELTRLPNDYRSHDTMTGGEALTYNNRLVYAGTKSLLYEGHKHFTNIKNNTGATLDVYVRIDSANGTRIVKTQMWNTENIKYYFFYPNTAAKEAWAFIGTTCVWHKNLEEHPKLNGAYYLDKDHLPDASCGTYDERIEMAPPVVDNTAVIESNQIRFSEVDNPMTFTARGVVNIGTGDILALSSITQALSQGQFGQYQLLAFTTEGVYAVDIDNEGYPISSAPMSREVFVKGGPIVNTDGAVFFASKKGLMCIVGDNVRCVSEQLSGEFPTRLAKSIIAYDYRDSLLWIVPKSSMGVETSSYCYIYNIKTGTFHTSNYFQPTEHDASLICKDFVGINSSNSDNIIEGRYGVGDYTAAGIKTMLQNNWGTAGVTVYGLRIVSTAIAFETTNKRFYNRVSFEYTIDDLTWLFAKRYYKDFSGVEAYVDTDNNNHPLADVYYRIRTSSQYYRWDNTQQQLAGVTTYPYVGSQAIDESLLFADGQALEAYVTQELSPSSEWVYRNDGVVYDTSRKIFVMRVRVIDDQKIIGFFYLKAFDGDADYVNPNNGHPLSNNPYLLTNNGALSKWDADTEELTPLTYVEFDYSDTAEQTEFRQGAYNEEALREELTQGVTPDFQNFVITEKGIVFIETTISRRGDDTLIRTTYNRFCYMVTCSFYFQGQQTRDLYFGDFNGVEDYVVEEDGNYHPKPMDDNYIYRLNNATYYRWNPALALLDPSIGFERTFAGLSAVINNYPDTLFQKLGDGIYSLMERPQPSDDRTRYSGVIETRPMKLENGLALKSIMQLRNIHQMTGTVQLTIWGSNNLRSWVKLRAFRNAPWKYFRFRFEFDNMKATDRFAGTVLITQERRTNKLR